MLFFLPWLDRSPVRSIRYRGPIYKIMLAIFVVSFIALAVCGLKPPSGIYPTWPRSARFCISLSFC
jgi:ubiquinol-cytochrome c reductase cytochrome b subunit